MLSEEEKEAIEFIKFYQQHCLKKEKENMKQYEIVNDEEFVSKNLDTVLNLIAKLQKENKEKDKQIKTLKHTNKTYKGMLNKQSKQIDLMAEIFYKRFKAELLLEYGFESKEEIKQYFERKVEDVKD